MSKVSNKTRTVRSMERDVQIDFESDAAVKLFGIDREEARRVIQEMGKRKRVWGLQAVHDEIPEPSGPEPAAGEISGWPLDPSFYEECYPVVPEAASTNGNGHTEGIVNGLDYRGMVPGAIPGVKIEQSPGDIPPYLNYP
jgi:hypothetical protein